MITVLLACLAALPAASQEWAIGVGSGAFVFGDFATSERTIGNPELITTIETSLSADTRAGLRVDVERFLNDRFSLRAESTFTSTKLSVKSETKGAEDDEGVTLDIGDLDVTTLALPLVWRVNRGAVRVQLYAGPAYAIYDMDPNAASADVPLFTGSRGKWGALAGAGLEWWFHDRWAVRGTISDIYTDSPLERSDFERTPPKDLEIDEVNNVHTLVGAVYRF